MNGAMRTSQSGATLRNEGRRVEQVPVIDADRADGRVKTQPEPDGVGHVFESDVTNLKEHIAGVIKGRQPNPLSEWIAKFEIEDCQRIAAAGDQGRQFTRASGLENDLRPGLFEAETAESGCAPRKKSFADRQ